MTLIFTAFLWLFLAQALTCATPSAKFAQLPLFFEPNVGQSDPAVRFLSRTTSGTVLLKDGEIVWRRGEDMVRMKWQGASHSAEWRADDKYPSVSHYFTGGKSHTGIPHFGRITAQRLYPGIDVAWYGSQRQLEYDLTVSPGADPRLIRLRFDGSKMLRLSEDGDLLIATAAGELRMKRPVAFQDGGPVDCRFAIDRTNEVRFDLGQYDRSRVLTIDPVIVSLSYSTLIGGAGTDTAEAIAAGPGGSIYVAGGTDATHAAGSSYGTRSSADAYVAQLNAGGDGLVFVAYLGGGGIDLARSIATDAAGNVFIAGSTTSTAGTFPLVSAAQGTYGGIIDGFVAKLSPNGAALLYSSYVGGSGADEVASIAVNAATGEAYVVGETRSNDFPTASPLKSQLTGTVEGFVTKFSSAGARLFSTYWGGPGFAPNNTHAGVTVRAVALDSAGNPVFTGLGGAVLPVTAGAAVPTGHETLLKGYVAKLSASGGSVLLCTYTEGSLIFPAAVAVDSANRIYIAGYYTGTFSNTPAEPRDNTIDVFWSVLNAAGTSFTSSGDFVGNNVDQARGIGVFGSDPFIYITGFTTSSNFPVNNVVSGTPGTITGSEMFVAKINPNTKERVYSTVVGGSGEDVGTGIAVTAGGVFVGGYTTSVTGVGAFPTTAGAFRRTGALNDAFVAKLAETLVCTFTLSPVSATSTAAGGVASILVTASDSQCTWSPATAAPWITLQSTALVTGSGSVNYTIGANGGPSRSGSITIAGQTFPITQQAPDGCVVTLSETSTAAPAGGMIKPVPVSATSSNCSVTVVSNVPWIKVFTVGTYVELTIDSNTTVSQRVGTATIAGQTYTVTQAAGTCTFTLSSASAAAGPDGALAGIEVNITASNPSCAWVSSSPVFWAQPSPRSGSGNGRILVTVVPNFATSARSTTVAIAGQNFTINQTASAESENQRFVRLLYFSFFGRTAAASEVQFHVNNLIGGQTRTDLVANFMSTAEFNAGGRFVAGLYVGLLNRDAEYPGWQFQRNALTTGGTSPLNLTTAFISTPEFTARFGTLSDADFVRHLYLYVLLRTASQNEVNFHSGTLSPTFTRGQMAMNFLNSAEFQQGTGPRLLAFLISAALQLRDPTPEERTTRVQQLQQSSAQLKPLIDGVLLTPAFRALLD
jgi:hypothetical protein